MYVLVNSMYTALGRLTVRVHRPRAGGERPPTEPASYVTTGRVRAGPTRPLGVVTLNTHIVLNVATQRRHGLRTCRTSTRKAWINLHLNLTLG